MADEETDSFLQLHPVGHVESSLVDPELAPRQGDEGAPPARLVLDARFADALGGLEVGSEVLVLTWLDRAQRDVLAVHPRDDPSRAKQGVFSTRSQDRPNPIGLHRVRITTIDDLTITVDDLEAVDGTPVLDVKPVIGPPSER